MLKARMLAETEPRTTISFYKYFTINDPQATRDELYKDLGVDTFTRQIDAPKDVQRSEGFIELIAGRLRIVDREVFIE